MTALAPSLEGTSLGVYPCFCSTAIWLARPSPSNCMLQEWPCTPVPPSAQVILASPLPPSGLLSTPTTLLSLSFQASRQHRCPDSPRVCQLWLGEPVPTSFSLPVRETTYLSRPSPPPSLCLTCRVSGGVPALHCAHAQESKSVSI